MRKEAVTYQQLLFITVGFLAVLMFLKTCFEDFSKGNQPDAKTTPAYVQNRAKDQNEYERVTQDYTQREKLKLYQSSQF